MISFLYQYFKLCISVCAWVCLYTCVQVLLEARRICQILWNWSVGSYKPELWVLGTKFRSPISSTLSQPLSCVSSPWFTVLKTESHNAHGHSCFGIRANIYRNEFKHFSFTKQDEFSQANRGLHLPSTGRVVTPVKSLACALDTAPSQWMYTFRLLP